MKKFTAAMLIAVLLFCTCLTAAAEGGSYPSLTPGDALTTRGTRLYNMKGDKVFLRGVNLGGWLIMEDWFCPVVNDAKGDLYSMNTLTERFGAEATYELFNIYQDNWLREYDFKNIADMGFNCVRIPFWYRNFQSDDNGTWIRDEQGEIDLSRLEWAVEMCRKYGIYAILDLHGANGRQGYCDHCGLADSYSFFDRSDEGEEYRRQAAELWGVIADRFAGDPAVAMFDLLNEPMCNVPIISRKYSYIWEFYDMAYRAIRENDPTRLMTMIGTWSVDKLPHPADYGWTGVIYQYHQYDKAEKDYDNRIAAGWDCGYDVPLFAGEFHPTGDNLKLDYAINAYDSNGVMWALWTYKGYNGWAEGADWFAYGSVNDELNVDLQNDSYDDIARKWGESMRTNSGIFKEAQLYSVAKKYLPGADLENVPFNDEESVSLAGFSRYVPPGLRSILCSLSQSAKAFKALIPTGKG